MLSNRRSLILTSAFFSLSFLTGAASAAEPPDLVNYQGVLRDADDTPLDGGHDMVFRFFSAELVGDEILVDSHTAAVGMQVTVSGGLFNVQLGSGAITDGSGPRIYVTLGEVFADYSEVWLEIMVRGETLRPRIRVASSPYAANAMHLGGKKGDEFLDTSSAEQSKLGKLVVGQSSGSPSPWGLEAYGSRGGGYFSDTDGTAYAQVGSGFVGVLAYGAEAGGYFEDSGTGAHATIGDGSYGLSAFGDIAGGLLKSSNGSGYALVGHGDSGITAHGNGAGALFSDLDGSGEAYVGQGDHGIIAFGDTAGGYFENSVSGNHARVGHGAYGIEAFGDSAGGYFEDSDNGGHAYVGTLESGIWAYGNARGGYFEDSNDSGSAYVAIADDGIRGWGHRAGGYFVDNNSTGFAYVGYGDRGIWGKGDFAGGTFSSFDGVTYWADVAQERSGTTYKIRGTGEVSFVQNHPYEKDKLVVYAAPEGDEVAVYTRGRAKLSGGEARVELGETFAWVANPDVGLTAHLTPRGELVPLMVDELSTSVLVVRGPEGSDTAFDYLVYGLRIGFERHAAVQLKDREAFLPPRDGSERFFTEHPELQRFSTLERFEAMRSALGEGGEIDLSRADALIASIDENREEIVAAARAEAEAERVQVAPPLDRPRGVDEAVPEVNGGQVSTRMVPSSPSAGGPAEATEIAEVAVEPATWLPVAEAVEAGDVLALDPSQSGLLFRAVTMADPNVIGVAAGPSRAAAAGGLEAPMAVTRYALVKADAGYGEIRPGDLLVASPTPGHAMGAPTITPGTVLGKAIDPLEVGTGSIRVYLVPR